MSPAPPLAKPVRQLTPVQVRAARQLLGWSRDRLAAASGIPVGNLHRYENGFAIRRAPAERLAAVRAVLEAAGIAFTGGGVAGSVAAACRSLAPAQLKAARALLGWSRDRLAGVTNVPPQTISDFENGVATRPMTPERLVTIRACLQAAGIEFTDGEAPGARLRQADAAVG